MYKVYSGKCLFWHYHLQLSFIYKPCLRFQLICFAREIKGFYQISFRNEVDFMNIMIVSQIFSFKTKLLLCLFFFLLFSLLNLDFTFNVVCNFLRTLMYFSENYNLNDSAISLPVFPSRTNLKLHNISITPKMVKKVIMG